MVDSLVVLVLVAAGERPDPVGSAVTLAARQALGARAHVIVEPLSQMPPASEAESLEERIGAQAVAEVDWRGSTQTPAIVRVRGGPGAAWQQRTIAFHAGDPIDECGRTIGFAIASLVERSVERSSESDGPEAPATSPSAPHEATISSTPVSKAEANRTIVEAVGVAAAGGASATSVGGGIRAGLKVIPALTLLVEAGARGGPSDSANASLMWVDLGCGLRWSAFVRSFVDLGSRVEGLALSVIAQRDGSTQSAWQPAARVWVDALWFPWDGPFGVVTAAGGEASFGSASLVVGTHTAASLPPFRAVAALGVAARF